MDKLAQQLSNHKVTGSYVLDCDFEDLRRATDQIGYALLDTNLNGVKGKQSFLETLARAAGIPPGFGANWDALADALCDLSWHDANGYVLLLRNANDTLGLSTNDREIAQDILADTIVYWRQRSKAFWIFFS